MWVLDFLVSNQPVGWQGCSVAKSSQSAVNMDSQDHPGKRAVLQHSSDAKRLYPIGKRQEISNPRHLGFISPGPASNFPPMNHKSFYGKIRRGKSK